MIEVQDPSCPTAAHPRLSRQSAEILKAFESADGHRLNCHQLNGLALRFGARIHDLRRAGYVIALVEHDHASGRTVYELRGGR